jgi:hypothetical protein
LNAAAALLNEGADANGADANGADANGADATHA